MSELVRREDVIEMLLKFALVGLSGVGVNMTVYVLLTALNLHYLLAATCSFVIAVTSNFFWNLLWTFRGRAQKQGLRRKYFTFLLISVLNLGINLMLLRYFVDFLRIGETIAQLEAITIAGILNFTLNYLISFNEPQERKGARLGDL